jgi:hypothetical protein
LLPPRPDELERPRDEEPLRLDEEPLRVEELRFEDRPLSFAVPRSLAIDSRWLPLLRRVELPISRRAEELLRPFAISGFSLRTVIARIAPAA